MLRQSCRHHLSRSQSRSFHTFRGFWLCFSQSSKWTQSTQKHLRATEAVEALWSEQGSRDATYRIASASIQDSRGEVFQIANVLPQKESSEFLEPELSQMESRQTKEPVVKHFLFFLFSSFPLSLFSFFFPLSSFFFILLFTSFLFFFSLFSSLFFLFSSFPLFLFSFFFLFSLSFFFFSFFSFLFFLFCNEHRPQSKQARMKDRDRESRMERDDRLTLFLDGLRFKAPVRSQHHDVCRAHACRDTKGRTTENYTRSPDTLPRAMTSEPHVRARREGEAFLPPATPVSSFLSRTTRLRKEAMLKPALAQKEEQTTTAQLRLWSPQQPRLMTSFDAARGSKHQTTQTSSNSCLQTQNCAQCLPRGPRDVFC